jgi:hypothetical protein
MANYPGCLLLFTDQSSRSIRRLMSNARGKLCSKESTSSRETPAMFASSCLVINLETRSLLDLKPILDSLAKVKTDVIICS